MGTQTKFDPVNYLDQLKRCEIENLKHLNSALDCDLEMCEMQELCRHLNCSVAGLLDRVAEEIHL